MINTNAPDCLSANCGNQHSWERRPNGTGEQWWSTIKVCQSVTRGLENIIMDENQRQTTSLVTQKNRNRLWNCLAVYLGRTIGVSASLDSAIGTQFYKLLSVFYILYIPHMPKNFICQHSAIVETTVQQRPLAFILCDCRCWVSLVSRRTALILAP